MSDTPQQDGGDRFAVLKNNNASRSSNNNNYNNNGGEGGDHHNRRGGGGGGRGGGRGGGGERRGGYRRGNNAAGEEGGNQHHQDGDEGRPRYNNNNRGGGGGEPRARGGRGGGRGVRGGGPRRGGGGDEDDYGRRDFRADAGGDDDVPSAPPPARGGDDTRRQRQSNYQQRNNNDEGGDEYRRSSNTSNNRSQNNNNNEQHYEGFQVEAGAEQGNTNNGGEGERFQRPQRGRDRGGNRDHRGGGGGDRGGGRARGGGRFDSRQQNDDASPQQEHNQDGEGHEGNNNNNSRSTYRHDHRSDENDREQYRRNNTRRGGGGDGGDGRRRTSRPIRPAEYEAETDAMFAVRHNQTGISFDKYESIEVDIAPKDIPPAKSFDEFQVEPGLRANIVRCGYNNPTPVQKYGIPVAMKGHDLMACAQTGSGKTAAFLLPVVDHILKHGVSLTQRRQVSPIAVVMAPTRELASQIFDESRKFCSRTDVYSAVVYGGTDFQAQWAEVEPGCDILVATPGRLKDLFDRHRISFARSKFLILDEADRMLDMGFEEQIEYLVASSYTDMPDVDKRQTFLYSATFPRPIQNLARRYLKENFYLLTVGRVGSTTKNITQRMLHVEPHEKRNMLLTQLFAQSQTDLVLVFVETKREAEGLFQFLGKNNIPCNSIHGDRKQWEREQAIADFKSGEAPILVATDVASRGLDIPNVAHVIQYDLPNSMDDYTHRIGRTGRAGNKGTATSFFSSDNRSIAVELMQYMSEHEQEVPDFLEQSAISVVQAKASQTMARTGQRGGRDRGGRNAPAAGPPARKPSAPVAEEDLEDDWEAVAAKMSGGSKKSAVSQRAKRGGDDGGF